MRVFGVKLLEHGDDFSTTRDFAKKMASEQSLQLVEAFDRMLIAGAATYNLDSLKAVKDLDFSYVPIGLGSGICGMFAARDALNLKTKIVEVFSAHAGAYTELFSAGGPVESPVSTKIAD